MQNLPKNIQSVQSLSLEALQEHAGWMRRLVGHMVRDAGRVDDLVQDAWMAAIGNPPPAGLPLKAWLKGIVGRTALASRRGEARLKGRELRHAEDAERTDRNVARDTAELSACAEQQRLLMEAVTKLPEGEKAVLLLRFFENLPPRAIAARLEIPVNTVRNRQRLGLQRLRESLDREHGGDSNAWAVAFLPLAKLRITGDMVAPAATKTALAMQAGLGRLALVALSIASLIGVGKYLMLPAEPENFEQLTTPQEAIAQLEEWIATQPLEGSAQEPRTILQTMERTAVVGPQFKGIVVDQSGEAIPGARIDLSWEPLKGVTVVGSSASWKSPWRTSDKDGRFTAPAEAQVENLWVTVSHPDYMQAAFVTPLFVGKQTKIEMVPLATTTIQVELVDTPSARRGGSFKLIVYQKHDRYAEGYLRQSALSESANASQGLLTIEKRFAVDRPIHFLISSVVDLYEEVDHSSIRTFTQGVENGITHVRFALELDGPEQSGQYPLARGQAVDADTGDPIPSVEVSLQVDLYAPNDVNLQSRPFGPRTVTSNSNGEYVIAMPKGSHEAAGRLSHPEYVPRDITLSMDASFGTSIPMTKRGELRCRVIDSQGQPVAGVPLLIRKQETSNSNSIESGIRLLTDELGTFELPNLLKGRIHVYILRNPLDADDNAIASESFSIKDGSSRDVVIQIDPPDRVHVTGQVLSGTSVIRDVVPVFLPYSNDGGWVISKKRRAGFDAGGLARGKYLVVLIPSEEGEAPLAWLPGIEITDFGSQHLELQMPNATVSGRVVGNVEPTSSYRILATPTETTGFAKSLLGRSELIRSFGHPIDPDDASFELPNLGFGPHQLELWDTAHPELGVLANMHIQVDGSIRLPDWVVED